MKSEGIKKKDSNFSIDYELKVKSNKKAKKPIINPNSC
jgi:hypothetical protein